VLYVGLRTLRELDAATGAKRREMDFPQGAIKCMVQKCAVRALALDPSGKRLAVALEGELALVDVAAWKVIRRWPQPAFSGPVDPVTHLEFTGEQLVATSARTMYILGAAESAPVRSVPGTFLSVAVLGGRVLSADVSRHLGAWDLASGSPAPLPLVEPK